MCDNLCLTCEAVKGYAAHMSAPVHHSDHREETSGRDSGSHRGPRVSPLPFDEVLEMAAIARRHYLEGRTRVEIAEEFGISRFRVSRLLEQAQRHGVVRIEIVVPESVDADVSLRLKEHFGLKRAIVVTPSDPRPEVVRDALGRAAARLMTELVTEQDVIGVTSGRTIDAMIRHLQTLPPCEVVQLTGMSGDLNMNSVEVVRRLTGVAGGLAHTIYAPLTLGSRTTAAALRSDPAIERAYAQFPRVTTAFVAVGSWSPPDSRFYDALDERAREELIGKGVCADVASSLVDAAGRPVDTYDDHTIGIDLNGLRAIPTVVVVGGGPRKTEALRAALLSGVADSIVTDVVVAEALLAEPASDGADNVTRGARRQRRASPAHTHGGQDDQQS
jgi:DNA-binding transcriptional regulator LsrR (DeoR family)